MRNKSLYILASVIVVAAGLFIAVKVKQSATALPSSDSGLQAVFLEGGEVYFGRLEKYNQKFYELSDVYYLKYGKSLQQNEAGSQAEPEQKLNLVRLGGEVHAPENVMFIDQDKVLFIENLKENSQVAQAIKKTN